MYRYISIEKDMEIVKRMAIDTEDKINDLLSVFKNYNNKDNIIVDIYIKDLLKNSLKSMELLERKLYQVSNYEGTIIDSDTKNTKIDVYLNFDDNDINKLDRENIKHQVKNIKYFLEQVITQINYQNNKELNSYLNN